MPLYFIRMAWMYLLTPRKEVLLNRIKLPRIPPWEESMMIDLISSCVF